MFAPRARAIQIVEGRYHPGPSSECPSFVRDDLGLGHLQVGSYHYERLIEGLYTL